MPKLIDLTGERFGRLTVIEKSTDKSQFKSTSARWYCLCDCGNEKAYAAQALRKGVTKSCGCLDAEVKKKHGMYGTPTYRSWNGMIARCTNPEAPNFANYGGSGVSVNDRWRDFSSFFEDMGLRPEGTTLDRIDSGGNYEPGNCRWATDTQQQRNKSSNHMLTANGETRCISEWAELTGIKKVTIRARVRKGWTHTAAVNTPPEPRRSRTAE